MEDEFIQLIASFEFMVVGAHQYLELSTQNLYFFITGGFIAVKKAEKARRSKISKDGRRKKALCINDIRSPLNFANLVQKSSLSKVEEFLEAEERHIGFYYSADEENTILRANQNCFQIQTIKKLRKFSSQKLKFFCKLQIFSEIPKELIQKNMHNFIFSKLKCIEIQSFHSDGTYLLTKKGSVVIEVNQTKGIILKAPSILGLTKLNESQQGRCFSDCCVGYIISTENLQAILKKFAEKEGKEFQGINGNSGRGFLITNYLSKCQTSMSCSPKKPHEISIPENQIEDKAAADFNSRCVSSTGKRRMLKKRHFQSMDEFKKEKVKSYFSNFYNERYQNLTEKMPKNLDENNQIPILYAMKPLVPKVPDYEEMKYKLKKIRMKKMTEPKQGVGRSISSQTLAYLKEDKDMQQNLKDSHVFAKIKKDLQLKIGRKLSKKYGTKMKVGC